MTQDIFNHLLEQAKMLAYENTDNDVNTILDSLIEEYEADNNN